MGLFLESARCHNARAMARYLIALALVFALLQAAWADITGQARVIDGDTIEVAGRRIRLHGIDAPGLAVSKVSYATLAKPSVRVPFGGHAATPGVTSL